MACAAAAVHKKKPQSRLLALLALSWACLQTAQPVRALAGPTVRAALFDPRTPAFWLSRCSSRPSTSSSISTGPHRQLRPLRVSPRRAVQASEPSESEDDKDKIVASARDEQLQKTAQEKEDKGFDKSTEKVANAQKFLALALARWESLEKDLGLMHEKWREAIQNGDKEGESKWESKIEIAESKIDKAKEEATKAREELEKAKSTAPLQADHSRPAAAAQQVSSSSSVSSVANEASVPIEVLSAAWRMISRFGLQGMTIRPRDSWESLTRGSLASKVRMAAESSDTLQARPGQAPAISDVDLAELSKLDTEEVFCAHMTRHLQAFCSDGYVVINSERLAWTTGWKPDFFIAHKKCYDAHKPPKGARLGRNAADKFGVPYRGLLDSLRVCEAKLDMKPSDLAELWQYLNSLPDGESRGMLFDKRSFILLTAAGKCQGKFPTRLLEGEWRTEGSFDAVRAFLAVQSHSERSLHAALQHASVQLLGFLGSGSFGRVFHVYNETRGSCAMKLVNDEKLARAEVASLQQAVQQGCPVAQPISELEAVALGNRHCFYYLSTPVGQKLSQTDAATRLEDVLDCLHDLHKSGIAHGDARLPNLIVNDSELLWIDCLHTGLATCVTVQSDIETLVRSLGASAQLLAQINADSLSNQTFREALQRDLHAWTY